MPTLFVNSAPTAVTIDLDEESPIDALTAISHFGYRTPALAVCDPVDGGWLVAEWDIDADGRSCGAWVPASDAEAFHLDEAAWAAAH